MVILNSVMIRICRVLALVVLLGLVAAGGETEMDWREHVIPAKERMFDFKTVARGAVPEHQFLLRNPLQETLHIRAITAGCECTTLHFDEEKTVLETYEELIIPVRLRGDRFDGQRNSTITIFIDQPVRTEIQLHVRGDIRSDLRISPEFIDFRNLELDRGGSRTLTVTYTGSNTQWRLVDARSENKFLRAEITLDSAQTRVDTRVFRVTISMDRAAPHGTINTHLILISNDTSTRREIPIPIRATVGTVLRVTPPALSLGVLQPGEPSPVRTAILSGTGPFRIEKIECDNPAVDIAVNNTGRDLVSRVYPLTISYRNPVEGEGIPENGILRAVIKVTTDVPGLTASFFVTATVLEEGR